MDLTAAAIICQRGENKGWTWFGFVFRVCCDREQKKFLFWKPTCKNRTFRFSTAASAQRLYISQSFTTMPNGGYDHVAMGSSANSSEEEVVEEPYVDPPVSATPAASGEARHRSGGGGCAAPEPVARAPITCQFCWHNSWGGLSALQRHQQTSQRCRYFQDCAALGLTLDNWTKDDEWPDWPEWQEESEAPVEVLAHDKGRAENRSTRSKAEALPDASPAPLPGKDKPRRKAKDKKHGGDKKERKTRREPTPEVRRKRRRGTPSPSPDGGGKQLRCERIDANTVILRLA